MKSAIWLDYFETLSPEEAVLACKEAGFSYSELGVDHSLMLLDRGPDPEVSGSRFRSFLEDQGYGMPQGHLDFQKPLLAPGTVDAFKRELTLFQAVGVRYAMIHISGGEDLPEDRRIDQQLAAMHQLLDFIKGTDITICLENLRPNPTVADADRILDWIHKLGGKNLGICLDTGHLQVARTSKKTTTQSHRDFILTAGKYLKATHINGNDGNLAPDSLLHKKGISVEETKRDAMPRELVFDNVDAILEENKDKDFAYYYLSDEPECRGLSPVYLKYL